MASLPIHSPETDGARNYAAIALDYAKRAAADSKGERHCKWVRLAAERHLRDLKRKDWPFKFDEWHANDVCDFIEKLPHVEGQWETPTLTLEPAQIFILAVVFGWRRKDDGRRRFTMAYVEMARKGAKSTLTAGVSLYCTCCEDEPGPLTLIGATTGDQARKVFNPARLMVKKTTALQEAFALEAWARSITCGQNGGVIQTINAKSSTQDGHNPHLAVLDELHAHSDRGLFDVIRSAFGARKQPLLWMITTAGFNMHGICYEQRSFVTKVLEQAIAAEHYFGIIFTLDNDSEEKYNIFQSLKHLEEDCTCGHANSTQIEKWWREACVRNAIPLGTMPKTEGAAQTILNDAFALVDFAPSATNDGRGIADQKSSSGNSQSKKNGSAPTEIASGQQVVAGANGTSPTSSPSVASKITELRPRNTSGSTTSAPGSAKSVVSLRKICAWITATARGQFEDCFAPNATLQSAYSEILSKAYFAHSPTCGARQAEIEDSQLKVKRLADDPYDERNWIKANPLYPITPTPDYMRGRAIEAKASPGGETEFKTKNLNIWMGAASAWLNVSAWRACGGDVPLKAFRGLDCYLGADLADKDDICSIVLAALDAEGRLLLKTWHWLPESALERASQTERENVTLYRQWRDERKLLVSEGDWIDHNRVERKIRRLKAALPGLQRCTFDQFAAAQAMAVRLNEDLGDGDEPFAVVLPKNARNVTDPAKDLEARHKVGPSMLLHDDNPVMTWMAGNVVVSRRVDGSILPKKPDTDSKAKIDGIDAAVNAIAPMMETKMDNTVPVDDWIASYA